MQFKSFNLVSVLALSGILLGAAFTSPSEAMDQDPSNPDQNTNKIGLKPDQIKEIKALVNQGCSRAEIAQEFGASKATIGRLLTRPAQQEEETSSEGEE